MDELQVLEHIKQLGFLQILHIIPVIPPSLTLNERLQTLQLDGVGKLTLVIGVISSDDCLLIEYSFLSALSINIRIKMCQQTNVYMYMYLSILTSCYNFPPFTATIKKCHSIYLRLYG